MDTTVKQSTIEHKFYGDHIPDYSKIQVVFFNPKGYPISKNIQDDILTVPNFYSVDEELEDSPPPVEETFKLAYSKSKDAYMVADQNIAKNIILMELFFNNRIDFFTKLLDMTEYNTILYSGT